MKIDDGGEELDLNGEFEVRNAD